MRITPDFTEALDRYLAAHREWNKNGNLKQAGLGNWEECRSYAVEALRALIIDNPELTGGEGV